jgi:hypothetical protein
MSRITILEGPDGGGKTTLAHHLRDSYGFRYHHEGPPEKSDLLVHYATELYNACVDGNNHVFDRCWAARKGEPSSIALSPPITSRL